MELNKVYCIDNLEILKQIDDESIDLIYSDILYGTGRNFKEFKDLPYNKRDIEEFYFPRIKEMHRILSQKGTLALQMDFRISHWIRCICDEYFGYKNCVNVIEWCYSSGGSSRNKLSQKNDTILIYAKNSDMQTFNYMTEKSYNRDYKPYRFKGIEEFKDEYGLWYTKVGMKSVWTDIPMVGRTSSERCGFITQKPIKLSKRIIELYTNENDVVGDFFCGSGTTMVVAKLLNRKYIGCDINPRAIEITNKRLNTEVM